MLTKTTITKKMTVSGQAAWDAISKIGRLDVWFPGITACKVDGEGVGAYRRMTLDGGGDITDKILDINPSKRRLTYQRLESPFPVISYKGTVEIFDSFDTLAVVVWTVDFESEPKDSETMAELLKAGIGAGLDGMEKDLSSIKGPE